MRENVNKLTTPMDIHNTFMNLISLELNIAYENKNSRSMSLFKPISSNRNCKQAGIDQHWCTCLKRTNLAIDTTLTKFANIFVSYLNNKILGEHLEKCHRLELDTINKVYLYDTFIDSNSKDRDADKFKDQSNKLKINLLTAPKIEKDYKEFFFQIKVKPNAALYEFTVILEEDLIFVDKSLLRINEHQISRINKYGSQSICIFDSVPKLRPFCFCKTV